jgi:hypothetical protein
LKRLTDQVRVFWLKSRNQGWKTKHAISKIAMRWSKCDSWNLTPHINRNCIVFSFFISHNNLPSSEMFFNVFGIFLWCLQFLIFGENCYCNLHCDWLYIWKAQLTLAWKVYFSHCLPAEGKKLWRIYVSGSLLNWK